MKKFLLFTFTMSFLVWNFSVSATDVKTNRKTLKKNATAASTEIFKPTKIEVFQYNLDHFGEELDLSIDLNADSIPLLVSTTEYESNTATTLTSIWDGIKWIEEIKSKLYYRNDYEIDSLIMYSYDTIAGTYELQSKFVYEYQDEVNVRDVNYIIDSLTGAWMSFMKTEYQHDNSGNLTGEVTSVYDEESEQWFETTKTDYFYSGGKLDYSIESLEIPGTGIEMLYEKITYQYDNNGQLESEISFNYNLVLFDWEPMLKTTYEFNAAGFETVINDYSWQDPDWVLSAKDSTVYIDNEKPVVEFYFEESPVDYSVILSQKTFYSYNTPVSADQISANQNLIQMYPNPTTNFVTLKIENPENAEIRIFDMNGKEVLRKAILSQTTTLSTQSLNRGNYIVKIRNKNLVQAQVLVVK